MNLKLYFISTVLVVSGCSFIEPYIPVKNKNIVISLSIPEPNGSCYYEAARRRHSVTDDDPLIIRPVARKGSDFLVEIYDREGEKLETSTWRFLCDYCEEQGSKMSLIEMWPLNGISGSKISGLHAQDIHLKRSIWESHGERGRLIGFNAAIQSKEDYWLHNAYYIYENRKWFYYVAKLEKSEDETKTIDAFLMYKEACFDPNNKGFLEKKARGSDFFKNTIREIHKKNLKNF